MQTGFFSSVILLQPWCCVCLFAFFFPSISLQVQPPHIQIYCIINSLVFYTSQFPPPPYLGNPSMLLPSSPTPFWGLNIYYYSILYCLCLSLTHKFNVVVHECGVNFRYFEQITSNSTASCNNNNNYTNTLFLYSTFHTKFLIFFKENKKAKKLHNNQNIKICYFMSNLHLKSN